MSLTEDLWAEDPLDRDPEYADPFMDADEELLTEEEAFGPSCAVATEPERVGAG